LAEHPISSPLIFGNDPSPQWQAQQALYGKNSFGDLCPSVHGTFQSSSPFSPRRASPSKLDWDNLNKYNLLMWQFQAVLSKSSSIKSKIKVILNCFLFSFALIFFTRPILFELPHLK
jgi:hypothetical protein